MLVFLAHRPKCIAWIFISLFCIELIITPVAASATGRHYSNYVTPVYGEYAWLRYMNEKYGDGDRKKANNISYKTKANKEKEVHKVGKKFSVAAPVTGGP